MENKENKVPNEDTKTSGNLPAVTDTKEQTGADSGKSDGDKVSPEEVQKFLLKLFTVLSGVAFLLSVIFTVIVSEGWGNIVWNISLGVFSNVFTALLVSLLATLFIKKSKNAEQTIESTVSTLDESIKSLELIAKAYKGKTCTFCRSYIKGIEKNREDCKLNEFFENAKAEISILVTDLESIKDYQGILEKIARNKGVNVRILAMHLDLATEFIVTRVTGDDSLKGRWTDMRSNITSFMTSSYINSNNNNGSDNTIKSYKFRLYKGIAPTIILFIADDSCYMSNLLNGQQARETTHFLFSDEDAPGSDPNSPVQCFKRHFEQVWEDSNTEEAYNYTVDGINKIDNPFDCAIIRLIEVGFEKDCAEKIVNKYFNSLKIDEDLKSIYIRSGILAKIDGEIPTIEHKRDIINSALNATEEQIKHTNDLINNSKSNGQNLNYSKELKNFRKKHESLEKDLNAVNKSYNSLMALQRLIQNIKNAKPDLFI